MSRLTKAKIERVLQAWVSLGLAVGGVEVSLAMSVIDKIDGIKW